MRIIVDSQYSLDAFQLRKQSVSIFLLAMWDIRCTKHYPLNDYRGQGRLSRRGAAVRWIAF
jgi:hypothetical protein